MNDNDRYEIDETPLDVIIITECGSRVRPTIGATKMVRRTACPHTATLAMALKGARS